MLCSRGVLAMIGGCTGDYSLECVSPSCGFCFLQLLRLTQLVWSSSCPRLIFVRAFHESDGNRLINNEDELTELR